MVFGPVLTTAPAHILLSRKQNERPQTLLQGLLLMQAYAQTIHLQGFNIHTQTHTNSISLIGGPGPRSHGGARQ